jgi:hypothetical protein
MDSIEVPFHFIDSYLYITFPIKCVHAIIYLLAPLQLNGK